MIPALSGARLRRLLFGRVFFALLSWIFWLIPAILEAFEDGGPDYQRVVVALVALTVALELALPFTAFPAFGWVWWQSLLASIGIYLFISILYHLHKRVWSTPHHH